MTLVTGGTRGIGAAIARRLADAGHDLVLGYLSDGDAAEATAEDVRGRGANCTLVQADITTDGGIDELFARAPEGLTGVVNNAGATYRFAPLADWEPAMIRKVIDVNLTAAVLIARAAVWALSPAHGGPGGVIVNISSGAATLGSPGEYVHYAAAKAGMDTLTKGLGLEVADQGMRVVGVAPGLVLTDIHANSGDPERPARMAPNLPMKRPADPAEIAEAVAFLMSDAASYITATTIRVAGGR
ncbi:SDR family oxidoreductase [Actinomadura adrarensis]|uniref:SDR family oxidoreductase n=1 Tax=Actinomadura adrarensis TaxID=1819600 RepID=A0ABW3CQV2_9ACTN